MSKFENPSYCYNSDTRTLVGHPQRQLHESVTTANLSDGEIDEIFIIFMAIYSDFQFENNHIGLTETHRKNYHQESETIFMEKTQRYLSKHFKNNKRLKYLINDIFPSLFEQKRLGI